MDSNSGGFDGVFDSIKNELDPKQVKRIARIGLIVGSVLFLGIFLMAGLTPWTEYLWFVHDVKVPEVFRVGYSTRGTLFSSAFVVGWICIYFNVARAFNITLIFLSNPSSQGQRLITNAITFLQSNGTKIIRFAAPVIAILSAIDFSNEFNTYLLATHAQKFGQVDPTYHLDLGFFVFTLPWYRALLNFVCALLTVTTVSTVGIYSGLQGLAAIAKVELGQPRVKSHIHALIGLTIIAYSAQLFLKTYEIGLVTNLQFTGAGASDSLAFGAQRLVSLLGLIVGVGTILNGWRGKPYFVASRGAILVAGVYILGVAVGPAIYQRLFVGPNPINMERAYAANAISMTRFAYNLNDIQTKDEMPTATPSSAEVASSKSTLDNMRLWDPDVLKSALESYQGIRPYYRFFDVDVDRYKIGGKQTLLMLSPRQLDLSRLPENSQNWGYERLVYTHGYGVVVARVDQATSDGEPVLLDQDIPEKTDPQLAISEPRIYFGQQQDQLFRATDEYAIVNSAQPEFDYPTSNSGTTTHWEGKGGIPLESLVTRLAYSVVLGDINILVSKEIRSESRLLLHRNVLERASRVLPFLKFDSDPYIFLDNGKVYWMLDGYTTTDMVPYSAMSEESDARLNYIRNSVKVVVDAYTGDLKAYEVEDQEPILKAWESVYPGLVHPKSEIPASVSAHFRYPEDMLNLQSAELCAYHVTDPAVYLTSVDLWNIASQRGLQGEKEPIRPFYVEMKLPDRPSAEFVQILPFSSHARPNMSGWLAAHCDPSSYGQLTLYRLDQATPMPGPEQIEGSFSTTPEIANINKQFQNQNSSIVVGNLLVIPIGNSFMYAESLFLKSNTQDLQSIPRLAKVILALKDRTPVVADTYREALAALLGSTPEIPEPMPNIGSVRPNLRTGSAPEALNMKAVKSVLDTLDEADAALKKGDFADYGSLEKQARQKLRSLSGPAAPSK